MTSDERVMAGDFLRHRCRVFLAKGVDHTVDLAQWTRTAPSLADVAHAAVRVHCAGP